ncbi:oxidoreductase [Croceicoccus estronivorus]|uniref:SDR family NAD(P)-dependent oxidoreductase n=1 Tax=Croceicoccus estronivorus TaxID=1172626 RepID=UPI000831C0BF|nr:SDR family NAD(P)-dependent oxidoreductase [Croceicoccus estronivorus]OCC23574.1 oxidoreductase [Croceicoccus estronivorus]
MYPDLEGKVAIVTGAGRRKGLGEAIARKLAEDGAKLVLHDLGSTQGDMAPAHGVGASEEMAEVAADIRAINPDVSTFQADMREEAQVQALIAHAVEKYARLDILVNNAGVGYLFGPLVDATQEMWDTVLNVNLRGSFFAMKHAVRQMLSQPVQENWGRGRVVSIGSRGSKSGSALTSSYIASKHGLVGLTRSAAIELGPEQITVNAVCPNHVTTGLGSWQNEFMAKARGQTVDEYLAAMRGRIPLGRVGTPDDTANACAFLCSGQARYITGEAMNVSGGEEMH